MTPSGLTAHAAEVLPFSVHQLHDSSRWSHPRRNANQARPWLAQGNEKAAMANQGGRC